MIMEYLKDKIYELGVNTKNRNVSECYYGTNESKKGYRHSANLISS
jgi:hypothetical protein